jgi:hypothetical protein
MRVTFMVLLCASLFACRTSDLGSCSKEGDCSPGAVCDLAARACVATDAPSFSTIAVSTPAAFTDSNGRAFFDTTGGSLSVSATITGRAGVDPATVCLTVSGETGFCAHPGIAGTGNTFTFTLPRPSGKLDGTRPADFTIIASSPSGRQSTSAVQHVYFDNQPPAITVATDSTPYARTLPDGGAAPITVSATIAEGAGVASAQLISGATQAPPASSAGNEYTFQLSPAAALPGTEGAYAFQVRAVDGLGHQSTVDATRIVDDAPPAVGTIKIYKGEGEPTTAGVRYPDLVPNTGWTGNSFIYNDTVHVKGTISDMSGIGPSTLRVDGIDLSGATSIGTKRSLGCSASSTTCSFDVIVQLNDAQNGAFHTGAATAALPGSTALIPSGILHIVIETQDNAFAYAGAAAHHTASPRDTTVRATRLLWATLLNVSSAAVTGLAIHPDLDVIATTDGGAATLYSLAAGDGGIDWSADAGNVWGPPAIGSMDPAAIYTADIDGGISAFSSTGAVVWAITDAGTTFLVGPAIAAATVAGSPVDQVVVPDNFSANGSKLWSVTAPGNVPSLQSQGADDRDRHASPMVFDGGVWFGTARGVDWHALTPNGGIGPSFPVPAPAVQAAIYYGTITDGTTVFAATRNTSELFAVTPRFASAWKTTLPPGIAAEPTLGVDSQLYVADTDGGVRELDPAIGSTTTFVASGLGGNGRIALHGSDDHWYLPRAPGFLLAFHHGQTSWTFDPPGTILRGAMMDCNGRLFVGSGASSPTVWAFITDDHGLADTPWPSWRRDGRNTGNAGAPKYGIRTAANTCDQ